MSIKNLESLGAILNTHVSVSADSISDSTSTQEVESSKSETSEIFEISEENLSKLIGKTIRFNEGENDNSLGLVVYSSEDNASVYVRNIETGKFSEIGIDDIVSVVVIEDSPSDSESESLENVPDEVIYPENDIQDFEFEEESEEAEFEEESDEESEEEGDYLTRLKTWFSDEESEEESEEEDHAQTEEHIHKTKVSSDSLYVNKKTDEVGEVVDVKSVGDKEIAIMRIGSGYKEIPMSDLVPFNDIGGATNKDASNAAESANEKQVFVNNNIKDAFAAMTTELQNIREEKLVQDITRILSTFTGFKLADEADAVSLIAENTTLRNFITDALAAADIQVKKSEIKKEGTQFKVGNRIVSFKSANAFALSDIAGGVFQLLSQIQSFKDLSNRVKTLESELDRARALNKELSATNVNLTSDMQQATQKLSLAEAHKSEVSPEFPGVYVRFSVKFKGDVQPSFFYLKADTGPDCDYIDQIKLKEFGRTKVVAEALVFANKSDAVETVKRILRNMKNIPAEAKLNKLSNYEIIQFTERKL